MSFYDRVYEAVCRIPKGKVATYGQIAMLCGRPRNARQVGYALNRGRLGVGIPAHRVVNAKGYLTGAAAFAALRLGWENVYAINMALFVMNLLPVLPLDGGIILKRILSYRLGASAARRALSVTSVLLAAAFAAAAVLGIYLGRVNLSILAMALFLLGNVLTSKEKYDVDFIIAASGTKKKTNRVRVVVVDRDNSLLKAAKNVSPSCTTIAAVMDGEGRITELLGEREIIERAPGQ